MGTHVETLTFVPLNDYNYYNSTILVTAGEFYIDIVQLWVEDNTQVLHQQ